MNYVAELEAEIDRLRELIVQLTSGGASLYDQAGSEQIIRQTARDSLTNTRLHDDLQCKE
jgi:hypothetical protein